VRNDIHLGDGVPLWIVSGSNMSGKSTLLRSCGLAVVLASMGAPVRAHRFRISDLTLAAAIRIQDSLLDGKSKFFVEVERLKSIIDLAGGSRRLLFLVDEILSGTNSQDRQTASEAVIRALLERDAIGLLTTHDLALTRVVDAEDIRAKNVHLADSGDSGGLAFDYTLKPGIIQKSNALAIVELLGIRLRGSVTTNTK
jgi:DNA mismatch repair ATPase MutS